MQTALGVDGEGASALTPGHIQASRVSQQFIQDVADKQTRSHYCC